jgi:hypothetical protein
MEITTIAGDFKIVSTYPLNFYDFTKVTTDIFWDFGKSVRNYAVIMEDDVDVERWVYWLVNPVQDDSYLDHEELV